MALINCPKCDKKISDTAEKCIGCGDSLKLSKTISNTNKKKLTSEFKEEKERLRKKIEDRNYLNPEQKSEINNQQKIDVKKLLINILLLIFILTSVIILIILMFDEIPYISKSSRTRGIDRLSEEISIWRTQVYASAYVLITALASLIYFNKR